MALYTTPKQSTSEMEVTSIRLERDLKEKLRSLAGNQGYQALVREILWDYVNQHVPADVPQISADRIRISLNATARRQERCALTGRLIRPNEPMYLGLTHDGALVPLSLESL